MSKRIAPPGLQVHDSEEHMPCTCKEFFRDARFRYGPRIINGPSVEFVKRTIPGLEGESLLEERASVETSDFITVELLPKEVSTPLDDVVFDWSLLQIPDDSDWMDEEATVCVYRGSEGKVYKIPVKLGDLSSNIEWEILVALADFSNCLSIDYPSGPEIRTGRRNHHFPYHSDTTIPGVTTLPGRLQP
eukprot:674437-Rhodomonas_salina.1